MRRAISFVQSSALVKAPDGSLQEVPREFCKVFDLEQTLTEVLAYVQDKKGQRTTIVFETEER